MVNSIGGSQPVFPTRASEEVQEQKGDLIDQEINRIFNEIAEEKTHANPSAHKIDTLVRQLAILLLRKSGRNEQQISELEIERMCQDLKNVLNTYNNTWSLLTNIGFGALQALGGMVSAGAGVTGVAQLLGGATKVSGMIDKFKGLGDACGTISHGFSTMVGQPLKSREESQRTRFQAELEKTKRRQEAAHQGYSQNRQATSGGLNGLSSSNDAEHRAAQAVLGG